MITLFNKKCLLLAVLGITLLIASCTVGPEYKSPLPPATKKYTVQESADLHGVQHLALGKRPATLWWQAFGSSKLNRTMTEALSNNYNLAAARAALARVREEAGAVAGAALWPKISLGAEAGRRKYGVSVFGSTDSTVPPYNYYTVGPQVSYLLDFAGGERRAIERNKALAQFQAYRFQAVRLLVTGNVVAQVFAIASARAQIDVVENIIADDRKNVELVRIARKEGSGTLTDVLSAQSQLAGDLAQLPGLRQQKSIAEHALAILVGKAPADWRVPIFELSALSLPRNLPLTLPSELVRDRPDIQASEAQLHAASAAVGVATARLYPSIRLTAQTTQQSLKPENLFNVSANAWALAAGLTAPIFNGGSLRAKKRASEQAYKEALANYQQVVIQSFGQVADVLKALEHDAEQVSAEKHALETAQASLKLARLSYKAGNIGILRVLDAERLFNKARLGVTRSRIRQYQDTALLFLALGGGSPGTEKNAVSDYH
jgi:NodT family efflux transporter outer membrane factor (OMF) lipoprotein